MLSVREAFKESPVWSDVVEVISIRDVGSNCGFEPGLVCAATVKTACGSIYQLRTTKKCYRLAAYPDLRSAYLLYPAPWDGKAPPPPPPFAALAAYSNAPSRIPKKRRRRS